MITYKKIDSYDLGYRDKKGNPEPVKFISHIWKRIDGSIIDSLKRELLLRAFSDSIKYEKNTREIS